MKRFLTIVFAFLTLLIKAQATNHFQHNGALWLVADSYPNANQQNPSFVEVKTIAYGTIGDSLINGDNWKTLIQANDSSLLDSPSIAGFVRKQGPRVYFLDTALQQDTLYDFSLNVGEFFGFNLPSGRVYLEVKKVDTVVIQGDQLRRIFFDEPAIPTIFAKVNEVWIENIGSVHGPLFPHNADYTYTEIPDSTVLTCSFEMSTSFYHNPHFEDCVNERFLGTESNTLPDYQLYPNPCQDRCTIQLAGSFHFVVWDWNGKIVLQGNGSNQHEFSTTTIEAGLYTLQISTPQGTIQEKLVKN